MGRKKPDFSSGVRRCPALGSRKIPVERCERDRAVRIRCGQHCEYNQFGLVNLAKFPSLELRVLRKLIGYYLEDPVNPVEIRQALLSIKHRKRAAEVISPRGLPYWYHLWVERDADGRSQVDRWRETGFKGLDADVRASLHSAGRSMQIGLIELEDHLRPGVFKVRTLLNSGSGLPVLHGLELDHKLPRYQPYLCRIYTTPFAWRIAGAPYMKWPDFGLRDARESFQEIIAHLGGPVEADEWTGFERTEWLVHNFDRFMSVVTATVDERRRLAKLGQNRHPSRVDYYLRGVGPFDFSGIARPSFRLCVMEANKLPAGFRHCWEMHETSGGSQPNGVVAMDGLRSGLVYTAKDRVRFETVDHERFQYLKKLLAGILGRQARVTFEYEDPAVKELSAHQNNPNPPLPPGLLRGYGEPPSRLIPKVAPAPKRAGPFTVRRAALKWIDEPQALLDELTPLESFSSLVHRAELMHAARIWVRRLDEECLLRGRKRDDYQFLRSLGLDRDLLNDRHLHTQMLTRLLLMHKNRLLPLPIEAVRDGALEREEVLERMTTVMEWSSRNQLHDYLQPVSPIFKYLRNNALLERISDRGLAIFRFNLSFSWYVLAGKCYWTPVEFRPTVLLSSAQKYSDCFYKFYEDHAGIPWELASPEWAGACSQPHLAHVLMSLLGNDFYEADLIPNDGEVDNLGELIGLQTALIDEFDNALRTSTDDDSAKPYYARGSLPEKY